MPLPRRDTADDGLNGPEASDDAEDSNEGSLRRCIASGERHPPQHLIRFAAAPSGEITVDIGAILPGRGMWLLPRRSLLKEAIKKRAFERAAKRQITVPPDLETTIERALVRRCVETIGLARRSGIAVAGYEKVAAEIRGKLQGGVLVAARDGAESGRRKMAALAADAYLFEGLTAAELGSAFGRDHVIHAVVGKGRLAQRLIDDGRKLEAWRAPD